MASLTVTRWPYPLGSFLAKLNQQVSRFPCIATVTNIHLARIELATFSV